MTMLDARRRSMDAPVEGEHKDLAMEVRRLLGWEGSGRTYISIKSASRKTGISHQTIANMANGDRPKADTIQKFAEGMGEDGLRLLELADYVPRSDNSSPIAPEHSNQLVPEMWAHRYLPSSANEEDAQAIYLAELMWEDSALTFPQMIVLPTSRLEEGRNDNLDAIFEALSYVEEGITQKAPEALYIDQINYQAIRRLYAVAKMLNAANTDQKSPAGRRILGTGLGRKIWSEAISLINLSAYERIRYLYSLNGIIIPKYELISNQEIQVNRPTHFTDIARFTDAPEYTEISFHVLSSAQTTFTEVFQYQRTFHKGLPENVLWGEYLSARSMFIRSLRANTPSAVNFNNKLKGYFDLLVKHWIQIEPWDQIGWDEIMNTSDEEGHIHMSRDELSELNIRINAESFNALGFDINMKHNLKFDWSIQGQKLTEELIDWYRTSERTFPSPA